MIQNSDAKWTYPWADARAHNAGRDTKYDARWKEMLANQGTRIALL
jgi:hypothetical protein